MGAETDRYPMPPLDGPAQLKDWMRNVERQLRDLQGARPLGLTQLKRGALRVVDDAGNLRLVIGEFPEGIFDDVEGGVPSDAEYGIAMFNELGGLVHLTTEDGSPVPRQSIPLGTNSSAIQVPITAGTYGGNPMWAGNFWCTGQRLTGGWQLNVPGGSSFSVRVVAVDVVTTVETVLQENTGITATTVQLIEAVMPSGAVGRLFQLRLQAKRDSGTGTAGLGFQAPPVNTAPGTI